MFRGPGVQTEPHYQGNGPNSSACWKLPARLTRVVVVGAAFRSVFPELETDGWA